MRILITTDTIGGVWTYTRELAAGLLQAGCELTLVTLGRLPSPDQRDWIDRTAFQWPRKFHARTTEYPLEWMQNNASAYSASEPFLLDCIRRFSPDIVHSSQFCYGALPVSVPKLVVAHSDVLSWWRASRGTAPENSPWFEAYLELVTSGLRGADLVVAPTRWMLRQVDCAYGPFRAAAVIPNGRDIQSPPRRPRSLQAVTAGRLWDEAKNVALLARVRSQVPLLVAGDEMFEDASSSLSESHALRRLGRLAEPDLLQLLAQSAIYIVTSRYEPFGLAAVEAALAGCAIVAPDIPSQREVWGNAAVSYAPRDAGSLSSALDRLAADPFALRTASRRASARARRLFSRRRMTSGYLALYRRLLRAGETRHAA